MAQLFDIKKVTVGPRALVARVEITPSAPLMTGDDPEGTERVLGLMPGLAYHACLGDASASFGEVISDTELAHLLEHVTVELLAQTNIAGDISSGQTVEVAERAYEITLSCPDDVLVAGALSSAAWVLQWAYSGGGEPEPDIVGNVYIRYDGPTFELFKVAEVRKGAAYGYLTSFTSHDGGDPAKGTRMMRQSYRSVDIAQLGDVYQLTDPRSPVHLIEARMDAFTRILEGIYSPDDGKGAVE